MCMMDGKGPQGCPAYTSVDKKKCGFKSNLKNMTQLRLVTRGTNLVSPYAMIYYPHALFSTSRIYLISDNNNDDEMKLSSGIYTASDQKKREQKQH